MKLIITLVAALALSACSKSESEITTRVTLNPDTLEVNGTTIVLDTAWTGEIHAKY